MQDYLPPKRGFSMSIFLQLSRSIDALNRLVGKFIIWFILASTLISAGNAVVRKVFHTSSNAYLEVQWYLFAWAFLVAGGYTLLHQEHVKIDVLYGRLQRRTQVWIEIFGFIFFLMPFCVVILYYGIPEFLGMYRSGEMSGNSGGLIRWPVWLAMPLGIALLMLQGVSELIKRIAYLRGMIPDPADTGDEISAEEQLAAAIRKQQAAKASAASEAKRH